MTAENPNIQKALDEIASLEAQIEERKVFVNMTDKYEGRDPRFPNGGSRSLKAETGVYSITGNAAKKWQPGVFYKMPLASAVREILLAQAEIPASVDAIHAALSQGSFKFKTSGDENQKSSIRISLGKNSNQFSKIGEDLFGLAEWYRKKRSRDFSNQRASAANGGEGADADTSADD